MNTNRFRQAALAYAGESAWKDVMQKVAAPAPLGRAEQKRTKQAALEKANLDRIQRYALGYAKMSVKQAAMEKEAMNFQPFWRALQTAGKGLYSGGKNLAAGTGHQAKRFRKFVQESRETLPETPTRLENPLSPGGVTPFNTMVNEINQPKFNESATQISGLYSGVSGNPFTAAMLRGLGGFTLGNSFNPYMTGLSYEERNKIGWRDPRHWGPMVTGALAAGMLRPGIAAKLMAKYAPNSALADQRILSNMITQPIVRLGATAALGDVAEATNQKFGLPALDGKLKPLLMTLGGLSGLRPLSQLIAHNSQSFRNLIQKIPNSLRFGSTAYANHWFPSGALLAKSQGWALPAISTGLMNFGLMPLTNAYTNNIQSFIRKSTNAYQRANPKDQKKNNWRYPFIPRVIDASKTVDKINRNIDIDDVPIPIIPPLPLFPFVPSPMTSPLSFPTNPAEGISSSSDSEFTINGG